MISVIYFCQEHHKKMNILCSLHSLLQKVIVRGSIFCTYRKNQILCQIFLIFQNVEYFINQCDVTNALKCFLIDQFVKFFLLIGLSKMLESIYSETLTTVLFYDFITIDINKIRCSAL